MAPTEREGLEPPTVDSEVINEILLRAEEELKNASSILNITSTGFNSEELNKAQTIENSLESELKAFDRKVFQVKS